MTKRRGRIGLAAGIAAGLSLVVAGGAAAAPGHVPGPPTSPPGLNGAPAPGHVDNPGLTKAAQRHAAKAPKRGAHPAAPAHPSHPVTPARHQTPAHPNAAPATPKATPVSPHAQAGKETICHATGSATNPYVEITISKNAIPAHSRHQDGRDIIPAPAGGCPGGAPAAKPAAKPAATPAATPAGTPAVTPAPAAPGGAVAGVRHTVNHGTRHSGAVHVKGVSAHGAPSPAAARVRAITSKLRGSLPFTGLQVFGVFALGALLLGTGLAVRTRA